MLQKVISVLGVVSAVTFAISSQFDMINPRLAGGLVLLGTAATAATGALTRYGHTNVYITVMGVVVSVASVIAGAVDLLPSPVTMIAAVVGTAVAAAGRSLIPGMDFDDKEGQ